MKTCTFLIIPLLFAFTGSLSAQRLVIGTYTNNNQSKGIYVYDFDSQTGQTRQVSVAEAGNPSYLCISNDNQFVYSINEGDEGKISSFTYDKSSGALTLLNRQPNNGNAPCYVSIDKTGKWLFAGNYGNGSLTVHPVLTDGSVGNLHQFIKHSGSSINKARQEKAHVHCTYMGVDNKHVFVPDLGLDKVVVYPFNEATGLLDTVGKSAIDVKPGGGPRHIVFVKSGKFAYLVEEMSGSVDVISKAAGNYKIIQTANHLPAGPEGAGADIHLSPDEKFLYVSQRSNSTIQIFKVNSKSGRITFIAEQSTMGNFPRNFTIHPSGKFLLAANQKSNDITIFKRDTRTGLLTDTNERIKVDAPVCLKWIGRSE
ncbi:MAG TPA: lactonase family protein [Niabella sp.]|nr:lactonase family protein [Niabella sp.]